MPVMVFPNQARIPDGESPAGIATKVGGTSGVSAVASSSSVSRVGI